MNKTISNIHENEEIRNAFPDYIDDQLDEAVLKLRYD